MTTRFLSRATGSALLVGAALSWRALSAQTPPTAPPSAADSFNVAFDRTDRRARMLLGMIDCAGRMGQLRAQGRFGPPDSVGNLGQCLIGRSEALGVFFSLEDGGSRTARLRAVDLRTGQRWTAPLDTAAAVAPRLALRDAFAEGAAPFEANNRPFGPIAIRLDGDSIEVWFLPGELLQPGGPRAFGGEQGFVYAPDGRTRARRIAESLPYQTWSAPDSGLVTLVSETDEPPLAHVLAFYVLQARRREVVLETRMHTLRPAGPGMMAPWIIQKRRAVPSSSP
jgi:hypothetical protein